MPDHIAEAHMTTRGQIALPKKVKEILSAKDGDYILFYQDGKRIYIEAGKLVPK
jgi:bifunctional DNA-binding transcriptional regulator/antitoxin component of YhaV-PrlF toxin-antitoxin module